MTTRAALEEGQISPKGSVSPYGERVKTNRKKSFQRNHKISACVVGGGGSGVAQAELPVFISNNSLF